MDLNLLGIDSSLLKDIEEIKKVININFSETGEKIQIIKLDENEEYVIQISKGTIKYKNKNHLFRAISLYIQSRDKENFFIEEKSYIKHIGPMIDASRNSVYKPDKIKELMVNMAILGLNRMMLYTEDTYEIENYKYFGYLRGKYSKEELKEIDDYGYKLGIEVIPCIQTLAHLKQTLKWSYGNEIKDTEDVLLVGKKKPTNL
ncbi:family 20 glycosylhydrolase [[Clostridium] dakarense]|uniref:family 20 glycosylhydrolase n=1 Tax=Faecalimicrobium dakarense TaxID=1301100 RepID=UPI0004BA4B71|nr:family 20 glycosylhydrolase [[Clostridium] dakarense]